MKEFSPETKQLYGTEGLKRGDGGRRGPKFKRFLFVLFWAYCHRCGVLPSAQEGVDLTSTLSALQCQEVCLTVCKYLDASTLPLAAEEPLRSALSGPSPPAAASST